MACEDKCFTFTWKLENASYCVQKNKTVIKSPAFIIDSIKETKWKLFIYPRGVESGNHISFYLNREANSQGADKVEIFYEFAFMAENGSVLKSYPKFKFDYSKNMGHGFPEFVKREDVFVTNRLAYLPQDTLTARCRIWKSIGHRAEDIQCFARTRIGVQKRSFLWNVKNVSTLESDKKLTNQIKSIENDSPLMSVDFSLTRGLSCDEIIRFELSLQDKTIKFSTLRLSLIDAAGNKILCNQDEIWFDDPSNSKEFKFFFTKDQLMAMKCLYLPDDILSLHWEWTFSEGVISEKIESVQHVCADSESKICSVQNIDYKKMVSLLQSLKDDLKSLYDEKFICDIKLKTNTRIFIAHKVVLSASSSVFKAMFSSDMKEKDSGCVYIEDLSDDTISRMLLFIYTARVEELTWENASHLYVAADKYDILNLKNICSSYLKDNLSPSNACQALLLSDFHSDCDLKSAVQNYIISNIKCIVNSDEWKQLMETSGKLAAETVCLQYK